uniref:THAP-type domain-containing protein n=1 Tax=Astyanax mexicanus TaxID=7994 RepID=A0A3B1JT54_ASTMX
MSYCSEPFCSNSKRKQKNLSFHDFSKDTCLRKGHIYGSVHVCSQHFRPEELYVKAGGSRARDQFHHDSPGIILGVDMKTAGPSKKKKDKTHFTSEYSKFNNKKKYN